MLTHAFDEIGNRTSVSAAVDSVADYQNDYQYDAFNCVTQHGQAGLGATAVDEKRVDFAYNKLGQFTSITRYSDLAGTNEVVTYAYDDLARLESLTHSHAATPRASYAWEYDALSRIVEATNADGTVEYDYDATGQLTGADYTGVAPQADEAYTYDANGNRTLVGYVTGANNQLLSDGVYDYTYDAEGNRATRTHIATGVVELAGSQILYQALWG